jgi:heme exporter protein D
VSAALIWIMCAVIVVSLAIWLVMVALADRTPYFRHTSRERRRGGRVMGGTHVGDGRSFMPPRYEPASETGTEADSPVPHHAGQSRRQSGSPLDL